MRAKNAAGQGADLVRRKYACVHYPDAEHLRLFNTPRALDDCLDVHCWSAHNSNRFPRTDVKRTYTYTHSRTLAHRTKTGKDTKTCVRNKTQTRPNSTTFPLEYSPSKCKHDPQPIIPKPKEAAAATTAADTPPPPHHRYHHQHTYTHTHSHP